MGNLASEIRSQGGGGRGSWIYREYKRDSLSQGLPRVKRVTNEIKDKHGSLFQDLDLECPMVERRILRSGKRPAGAGCSSSGSLPAFFHPLLQDSGPEEGEGHEIC